MSSYNLFDLLIFFGGGEIWVNIIVCYLARLYYVENAKLYNRVILFIKQRSMTILLTVNAAVCDINIVSVR